MADLLDVLTFQEAEAEIGGSGATDPNQVAAYVTAVSRKLDVMCGPVVVRTVTDTFQGRTWESLFLRQFPVLSVTTVTEYDTAGNAQVLTAETAGSKASNGYLFESQLGRLSRRASGVGYQFPPGGAVTVVYEAGRFADTASVEEPFKTAARIIFQNMWRWARGTGNRTFGAPEEAGGPPGYMVPYAAVALLEGQMRVPATA